jgi:hypothetical protein
MLKSKIALAAGTVFLLGVASVGYAATDTDDTRNQTIGSGSTTSVTAKSAPRAEAQSVIANLQNSDIQGLKDNQGLANASEQLKSDHEKMERPEKAERPERAERPEVASRPDIAMRPDMTSRPGR